MAHFLLHNPFSRNNLRSQFARKKEPCAPLKGAADYGDFVMSRETERKIYGVESEFHKTQFMPYLDAFKFDCQIRNLTEKTIAVYFERLTILFRHL